MKLQLELKTILFDSKDYRHFLRLVLKENGGIRGYKSQLAKHAGCQAAYFSQVIADKVHLTPEQTERIGNFWELNEFEADYFFNLVLKGRAGSLNLERNLEKKLLQIKGQWKKSKATYGDSTITDQTKALLYYSHWMYSAVHILLTVPEFQKPKNLSKHLRVSESEIIKILEDLTQYGFAEKINEGWKPILIEIHADQKDFFSEIHHKNWRSFGLDLRREGIIGATRYTSVHSLSKDDFIKIKATIEQMIIQSRRVIESSPEEICACLLIDYFSV